MVYTGQLGLANSIMKFGAPGRNEFKQWMTLDDARVERYPHLDKAFLIVRHFGYMELPPEYNDRVKAAFDV